MRWTFPAKMNPMYSILVMISVTFTYDRILVVYPH